MSTAQSEGMLWYFGQNAGLDFRNGDPEVLTDGELNSYEGCSVINDEDGQLQFYTDGVKVWNRRHEIMPNGSGLYGNQTSTQSALIIRKPGSNNLYYIFTTNYVNDRGLRYSIVDMSKDDGLGDVIAANRTLLSNSTEKLTAIRHQNQRDYWILGHQIDNNHYCAFFIDPGGINTRATISKIGLVDKGGAGYLKASLNGTKIAAAIANEGVELFDFDNATGLLSNSILLDSIGGSNPVIIRPYGLEFSPGGNLLYMTQFNGYVLSQFDLLVGGKLEIENSRVDLGTSDNAMGALLLAPNGKIYVSEFDATDIGVIHNPNLEGLLCNFEQEAIYLGGKKSSLGLPNFNNAYTITPDIILYSGICVSDTTRFSVQSTRAIDSIWYTITDLAGNKIVRSGLTTKYVYSTVGTYPILVTIFFEGSSKDLISSLQIISIPTVDLGPDTLLCEGQSLILEAELPFTATIWQEETQSTHYQVRTGGNYQVNLVNECGEDEDDIDVILSTCDCEMYIPNVFTPDDNGLNDNFKAIHDCDLENYEMVIYNRWGQQLFTSKADHVGWNGSSQSKPVTVGTYYYILYYTSKGQAAKHERGVIYLMR